MRRRLIILALVFLAAISLSAQQQPTFRSNVRLVNVTVVAHDSSGRPVMNLTAGDFQVFEDGKEEKIEVFAIDTDRPVQTATAAPQPAPALATNIFTNRQKTRDGGGVTAAADATSAIPGSASAPAIHERQSTHANAAFHRLQRSAA